MPDLYRKTGASTYSRVIPYVRTASGWVKATYLRRKTGTTTWTETVVYDKTPPGLSTITSFVQDGNRLRIAITAPADSDVTRLRVKVVRASSTYPNSSPSGSGWINNGTDGNDPSWSEWVVTPGQSRAKFVPITMVDGANYKVSVYAVDRNNNVGSARNAQLTYKAPATIITRTQTINPANSATWRAATAEWYTNDDYVRSGSPRNHGGAWFYNTRIQNALRDSIELTRARIRVQRVAQSFPDNSTDIFRFSFFAHNMQALNVSVPPYQDTLEGYWPDYHRLKLGETIWITLPETWYGLMRSGTIRGFGINYTGSFSNESLNTGFLYGASQLSGALELTFTQKG